MDYTQAFLEAVQHLMLYEVSGSVDITDSGFLDGSNLHACGYTNDPDDSGGETKYGIAKNSNPNIDIKNLDWETAKSLYYSEYWLIGHCDKLPGRVAALHFDGCVNNGVTGAAKFLQHAVNVTADGNIGPQTIAAINSMDEFTICNSICDQRTQYYQNIVNNNPAKAKYLSGWFRRISEMRTFTTNPSNSF